MPRNTSPPPIAHDQGPRARQVPELLQGALGLVLLVERHAGDQDDEPEEHQVVVPLATQSLDGGLKDTGSLLGTQIAQRARQDRRIVAAGNEIPARPRRRPIQTGAPQLFALGPLTGAVQSATRHGRRVLALATSGLLVYSVALALQTSRNVVERPQPGVATIAVAMGSAGFAIAGLVFTE